MDKSNLKYLAQKHLGSVRKLAKAMDQHERIIWNYILGKYSPTLINFLKMNHLMKYELNPLDYLSDKDKEKYEEWFRSVRGGQQLRIDGK